MAFGAQSRSCDLQCCVNPRVLRCLICDYVTVFLRGLELFSVGPSFTITMFSSHKSRKSHKSHKSAPLPCLLKRKEAPTQRSRSSSPSQRSKRHRSQSQYHNRDDPQQEIDKSLINEEEDTSEVNENADDPKQRVAAIQAALEAEDWLVLSFISVPC